MDDRRVEEIVSSLGREGCLFNPIAADCKSRLVIDGQHRITAFRRIGQEAIPAFDVDYLSPSVAVRGWTRATDADPGQVRVAAELAERPRPGGDWRVIGVDRQGSEFLRASFADSHAAAEWLQSLVGSLENRGHRIALIPQGASPVAPTVAKSRLYLDPFPGKEQVLGAVAEHRSFPPQVNRHLVTDRPLGVNIPLPALGSPEAFQRFLDERRERQGVRTSVGAVHEGRWFEERVELYDDSIIGGEEGGD
ncbi:MAG: hypothetical protein ACTHNY_05680 [Solirubrobacterales bacterium]